MMCTDILRRFPLLCSYTCLVRFALTRHKNHDSCFDNKKRPIMKVVSPLEYLIGTALFDSEKVCTLNVGTALFDWEKICTLNATRVLW